MTDYTYLATPDMASIDVAPYTELILDITTSGVSLYTARHHDVGSPMPADVWHGRCRRYVLTQGPATISRAAFEDLLGCGGGLSDMIDTIRAGFTTGWEGDEEVGLLDYDASEADVELAECCADGTIAAALDVFKDQ